MCLRRVLASVRVRVRVINVGHSQYGQLTAVKTG